MKLRFKKLSSLLISAAMLMGLSTTAFAETNNNNDQQKQTLSMLDNTTDRVLNIYKYTPANPNGTAGDGTEVGSEVLENRTPLENVQFDIYKVAEIGSDIANSLPAKAPSEPTDKYEKVTTITTNATGLATYNFGKLENNVYYVVEKDNPAIENQAKSAPFYVSVPYTNPDENGWLYTVNVYPKNNVKEGPDVNKDVDKIDNKHLGVDLNKDFKWIIRGEVPSDLYYIQNRDGKDTEVYAKNYTFTDAFDERLDYVSVALKVADKNGNEVDMGKDLYTDTYDEATRTLTVSLTNAGMKSVMDTLNNVTDGAEIRAYVTSKLNEKAEMGIEVPNNVKLDYTNSVGKEFETTEVPEDNRPKVHTGGLLIKKVDAESKTVLKGAEFKIAATEDDAKSGKFLKDDEGEEIVVKYRGEKPEDDDGTAWYNGLAYDGQGTVYYLFETKAPDGYRLPNKPFKVTVNSTSHMVDNIVEIPNSKKFVLPVTGGAGIAIFFIAGIALVGSAVLLIKSEKKPVTR